MKHRNLNINYACKFLIAVILATFCAHFAARADVFWRWGASSNIERLILNMRGKESYSADVNINGTPAKVSLFGFKDPEDHWVNTMHSLSVKNNDIVTMLLAVQLKKTPILFKIDRPIYDKKSKLQSISEIPAYPQSVQAFYSSDEKSNLSISVSRSKSSPAEVRSFYRSALSSDGWHLTTSATENSSSGMSAYIRDNELACVAADKVKISGETRITLVYKKLKIK